jgi:NAD(P)-dependent dehydrogenase (short-subunit alcohol dehydrogenase family)
VTTTGECLVWVTGASQGIGQALVETVPWPGARVIGVSRSPGPAPVHLAADLSGAAGWDLLEDSFRRELAGFSGGRVVLVHAAGAIGPIGFAGETDPRQYRASVLLNAAAPLIAADAFLRAGRHLGCRRQLILMSSGAAQRAYPGVAAYGAAKAAVEQWVRAAGKEQARRGGVQVLVLEAGDSARTHGMTVPNAWPENLGSPADWGEYTTPQASTGPVRYPRGRALGGSGAINAMAHIRGHRAVYDSWAESGAAGWGFADLLPHFQRSERTDGRDPALRGTAGPVRVGPAVTPHPVASAFMQALATAGYPATDDLSGAQQEGACWPDLAISNGERASSADAYLRPNLGRPNLTVTTDCLATGLVIDRGRDGAGQPGLGHAGLGRPAGPAEHRPRLPAGRARPGPDGSSCDDSP